MILNCLCVFFARCDRCQWLTYWVVYSTFTLIESATDVLSLWIPLYPVVKVNGQNSNKTDAASPLNMRRSLQSLQPLAC